MDLLGSELFALQDVGFTPKHFQEFSDTSIPLLVLQIQATAYVNCQLDTIARYLHATMKLQAMNPLDEREDSDLEFLHAYELKQVLAYQFKLQQLAWKDFTDGLGIDGEYLVRTNCQASTLSTLSKHLCDCAPTDEEFAGIFHRQFPTDKPPTAKALARRWQETINRVLDVNENAVKVIWLNRK